MRRSVSVSAPAEVNGRSQPSLRGFTLIELLVVISIIALLAGILLPSLAKGRALGRSAACKGNLHAAGSAFQMYLNDSNDVFPDATTVRTVDTDKTLLVDALGLNLSSPEVLLCPDDTDKYVFLKEGSSYYYNTQFYNLGEPYYQEAKGNEFFHHRLKESGEENMDVLTDSDDDEHHRKFHEGVGGKNFLFLDWHVTE